jgi:transcriptional regulator with XRE-family HTH domain
MTYEQVRRSRHGSTIRTSDLVAIQVKQLRGRRGLTVKDLAGRCRALGAEELTANVLTNIEVRRRDVSVDELFVLALALDAAPVHLLTPSDDQPVDVAVTSSVVASTAAAGHRV